MKKSQLKNIIRESIKELMKEQNVSYTSYTPGTIVTRMDGCEHAGHGNPGCIAGEIQVGDTIEITGGMVGGVPLNQTQTGQVLLNRTFYVKRIGGKCNPGFGPNANTYKTANINQSSCTNCCNEYSWSWGAPNIVPRGYCWYTGCGNEKNLSNNPLIHRKK